MTMENFVRLSAAGCTLPPYASSRAGALRDGHLDFDSLCLSPGVLRLASHSRRHYGQKKMRGDKEQVSTVYQS